MPAAGRHHRQHDCRRLEKVDFLRRDRVPQQRRRVGLPGLRDQLGPDYRIADFVARSQQVRRQVAATLGQGLADTHGRVAMKLTAPIDRPER
jgi:hypothetical protein